MRSLIAFCALAAVAAAAVVDTSKAAFSHLDIGTYTFIRAAESPNSMCPQNITHGAIDTPPLTNNFMGFGIEGSMNYSQIKVEGVECTGAKNDSAIMAILSLDELKRFRTSNLLNLNETAAKRVFVSSIDTQERVCGNYRSSGLTYYLFTKEIAAYDGVFKRYNLQAPKPNIRSGEKWMLAYVPKRNSVCIYIDEKSPSLIAAGNITAIPSPSMTVVPTPEVVSTIPPASELAGPEVSPAPTKTPTGRICFPSVATVELADGSIKTMNNVVLGDRVKVADGLYSSIFMFTHKLADVQHSFVSLKADTGAELALTAGHFLYVNGALAPAGTVKTGDMIESGNGDVLKVVSVGTKTMSGLYNPQTAHGDIIVNGIRASTYTSAVTPRAAHALLAPLRAIYARLGLATAALDKTSDFVPSAVTSLLA